MEQSFNEFFHVKGTPSQIIQAQKILPSGFRFINTSKLEAMETNDPFKVKSNYLKTFWDLLFYNYNKFLKNYQKSDINQQNQISETIATNSRKLKKKLLGSTTSVISDKKSLINKILSKLRQNFPKTFNDCCQKLNAKYPNFAILNEDKLSFTFELNNLKSIEIIEVTNYLRKIMKDELVKRSSEKKKEAEDPSQNVGLLMKQMLKKDLEGIEEQKLEQNVPDEEGNEKEKQLNSEKYFEVIAPNTGKVSKPEAEPEEADDSGFSDFDEEL